MNRITHFIAGRTTPPSERSSPVFNPATGQQIATVSLADSSEVQQALEAAKVAFTRWSLISPLNRARVLFRFKAILESRMDDLIQVITGEHGKVLDDARGEIIRGLEVVEFACGIPHLLKGDFTDQVGTSVDAYSLNQPLGVVAGITPFNFPAMVPMWMWPIAVACGNCFILKPSEKDPSASLLVAKWLQEAGLPDGVFNVVNGDKEAVEALLASPDIEAVSFVGSTPIAEAIFRQGSANGKRVQALGGAKNHLVVMPDADLDAAVNSLIGAAYGSAGERCMAISVAVAVGDIADELVSRLSDQVQALVVGDGVEANVDMGPLISKEHLQKVTGFVDKGVQEGAHLVVDGRGIQVAGKSEGYFLGGCLFDHVQANMEIYREEIFGPVLCVVRVPNYQAAVSLINGCEFANGTSIFTRSGSVARNFTQEVQVGMVGVNVPIPVPMAFHSFGGWKRSLYGANHMHGLEGVRFYTRRKAITVRWPEGDIEAEFTMPIHK